MPWIFVFFLISGFCSILYELIWLRLAMADFGVTSAMMSTVLSMFMAGLGLGSWISGRITRYWWRSFPGLWWYALCEMFIGFSALAVPAELAWGRNLLHSREFSSSLAYYLFSGIWIGLTLIPWCACIGLTIPMAMHAIRSSRKFEATTSFSYLYVANVLGATVGTVIPVLLIEIFGFHRVLLIGATLNMVVAAAAFAFGMKGPLAASARPSIQVSEAQKIPARSLALLFASGACTMGLEVVWIRQFTAYLGTVVYAFAAILGFYLFMTFLGSGWYRLSRKKARVTNEMVWAVAGLAAMSSLFATDPSWKIPTLVRLVVGIGPFTLLLGYLTPMLVDRCSGGDPGKAGTAYAVNVMGCIVGPLISGFVLLPIMNERWVTFAFSLPWFAAGILTTASASRASRKSQMLKGMGLATLAVIVAILSKGYEDQFSSRKVLRDHTATVIATGEGMDKRLLVNGVGMTNLTPITKMMAHLPLAFLGHPPQSGLIICFGMGTSYRSMLSWNIQTTAVDLVPSVPKLFSYYHADAAELMRSPISKVINDDGRRYLERTSDQYDVIAIDPPPPVQAAGSSLLYSVEFYQAAKRRLRKGGILQQWLPAGDEVLYASVTRALTESFVYVRVFRSVEGWGYHFLCSNGPIPERSPEELAKVMPARASRDLVEWGPSKTAEEQFALVLGREVRPAELLSRAPRAPALQDDRPVNEYFFLRTYLPYEWREFVSVGR
jgi:spermidine synthase